MIGQRARAKFSLLIGCVNKVCGHTAMPTGFCIVYGCFHSKWTESSSCFRDCMGPQSLTSLIVIRWPFTEKADQSLL